jgi:hypothetical protein
MQHGRYDNTQRLFENQQLMKGFDAFLAAVFFALNR